MKQSFPGCVLGLTLVVLAARAQAPAFPESGTTAAEAAKSAKSAKSRAFPHINPPPLPPVEQFDQLLRASPDDRTNQLAGKSAAARRVILRALAQFDTLTGVEREQRVLQLRVAQLRFFLRPLLSANPEDRAQMLAATRIEDRILVESRLAVWEKLPEFTRQEVLESDAALQHFVRQASTQSGAAGPATNSPDTVVSREVQQSWDRWQLLLPEERARREANFRQFFDLTRDEQIRAIGGLPTAERQRMEYALTKFNQLPSARRDLCVQNFDRLARLPEPERTAFLRNAAKWEAMTQAERDAWRRLLLSVPPPPMPPLPANVEGGGKVDR